MKKNNFFAGKRVTFVISLVLASLSWIVIAGFVNPGRSDTIPGVAIDYERYAQQYIDKNLQIAGAADPLADVMVEGDSEVLGVLGENSVTVYVNYAGVNGPGTYELLLRADKVETGSYSISDLSVNNAAHSMERNPKKTVTLTFEEVAEKYFDVTVRADGVTAAPGFFRDPPYAALPTVRIYGSRSKLDLVAQVLAELNVREELEASKTYTAGAELMLLDKSGAPLDANALGLTVDPPAVSVEVPILGRKTVALTADFIGAYTAFDTEWFQSLIYISTDTIEVVGSAADLDHLDDPYPVATFDLRDLDLGWESDPVTIELPEGLRTNDQLRQVTVGVNTAGFAAKNFDVNAVDFYVAGAPQDALVNPTVTAISVMLIGPEEQMAGLLPENISVRLDASDLTANVRGQHTLPARISVPGANRLIPVGEYSVVCDVVFE